MDPPLQFVDRIVGDAMHVVILTRRYHPSPSPSGSLIQPVVEQLAREHKVTVVAVSDDQTLPDHQRLDGYSVLRPRTKRDGPDNSPRRSTARRILGYARRIIGVWDDFISSKDLTEILQPLNLGTSDVVMAITGPTILAAARIQPTIGFRFVPFFLEQLPTARPPRYVGWPVGRWQSALNRSREDRIFAAARRVLALPTAHQQLLAGHPQDRTKLVLTEHPMIRDLTRPVEWQLSQPVQVMYAGGFDLHNRNPQFLLKVLGLAREIVPLHATFYTYGNSDFLIERAEQEGWAARKSPVAASVANEALAGSHIVLTQGNANPALTPSKIFDCMSTGRPIVHFYYRDSDPYLEYLNRYGLGYAVRIGSDPEIAAQGLAKFITANANRSVSYVDLADRFRECTPEQFVRDLEGLLEDQP